MSTRTYEMPVAEIGNNMKKQQEHKNLLLIKCEHLSQA
jgi:hypothetical protein